MTPQERKNFESIRDNVHGEPMTQVEAMKLALDALESAEPKYTRQRADQKTLGGSLDYWKLSQDQRLQAITALHQAIEQAQKHEPVAWLSSGEARMIHWKSKHPCFGDDWIPLYTSPQASLNEASQRQWVGLTDKERFELSVQTGAMSADWLPFMEAVEAKLKEKNNTPYVPTERPVAEPHKRPMECKPLTDEQIEKLLDKVIADKKTKDQIGDFARAIEAAHGIKEEA